MDQPAAYTESLEDGRIRCRLCPHGCKIEPQGVGDCLTRRHDGSRLVAETYARLHGCQQVALTTAKLQYPLARAHKEAIDL